MNVQKLFSAHACTDNDIINKCVPKCSETLDTWGGGSPSPHLSDVSTSWTNSTNLDGSVIKPQGAFGVSAHTFSTL